MGYKIISEITEDLNQDLLNLIHLSFDEYDRKGIHFTCSSYTMDDLKNKVLNGRKCYVALDNDRKPIGITSVEFDKNSQSAYESITAIHPNVKGMGVGTALYEERTRYLKSQGCKYMMSDTSENAKSSVQWHLKKCHCRIVDYWSYKSTNYFSYVFREDFVPVSFLQKMKDKMHFIRSYCRFHLFYDKNGQLTRLGKMRYKNR